MKETKDKLDKKLSKIKNKIMVMSGKGGVGKTTVAVNLAFQLALIGNKTGLLDADIHGPNVPKMLGIEDKRPEASSMGIKPVKIQIGKTQLEIMSMAFLLPDINHAVIWRGPLKMGAIKQFIEEVEWGDLDYLIVDLPPGTGDEPLSIAQLMQPDGAVIVTTPQDVALLDSRKAVNFAKQVNVPIIGIIENMSGFKCPHCSREIELFKIGGGEKAADELGVRFLGRIPIDPEIVISGDSGKPFILSNPDSYAAKSFNEIIDKIKKFKQK
ncbi:MAG: ATP-binding protein [Candidatus Altiarchaeales archaeon WOR_SM1_86-2]|nr:MAG: ATP-binding protein [Candidatus Altiarchaeales archaeon WOR_SM1_86-2]